MKYKFNENNNITGYIKEILYNFNLPTYKVYKPDKEYIDGRSYIVGNNISKYNKKEERFVKLADFEYGKKVLNSTTNLKMNSTIYDTYTHEYLGRFLRFIRDYRNLDLMPLYNCFSYNKPFEFNLTVDLGDNKTILLNTGDSHYDYYLVPITFGQDYTIAIDSPMSYEICTLIYTGNKLLDISKELIKESCKTITGSKFSSPFIYTTPEATKENGY